jgi:hypothetical protein
MTYIKKLKNPTGDAIAVFLLYTAFLCLFNIFLTLQEVQVLVFLCSRPLYVLLNLFFTAAGGTSGGFFTVHSLYMSFKFIF